MTTITVTRAAAAQRYTPPVAYTVEINPDDPASIDAALRTEWLLTNGVGGYAMGTLLGANTRRYHGLYVAATKPPVGRVVALHSVIDRCTLGDRPFDFGTQQFIDGGGRPLLHPEGWRHLRRVQVEPPYRITWTYHVGKAILHRRLMLEHDRHEARLEYEIENAPPDVHMSVRPLMPLRDFHAVDREGQAQPQLLSQQLCQAIVQRGGVRVRLGASGGSVLRVDPQWWRGFAYTLDRERGQEWRDDAWSPGACEGVAPAHVRGIASLTIELLDTASPARERGGMNTRARAGTTMRGESQCLAAAAKAFIVARPSGTNEWAASVIAGYPWFGDWGRDTMIALPGLMLCTGRGDEAHSTLECFARHLRNGLLPNLFDDYGGAAHYNTVDASLWFVHAVHALWSAQGGRADRLKPVWRSLLMACREVIDAYRRGTDFDIRMDEHDGLITAGNPTTQLTWMDAARDGVVFTPRCGKAVEINALWHNALLCISEMTDDEHERNDLIMLARRVAAAFSSAFWWDERQCLHDCLERGKREEAGIGGTPAFVPDHRLRPNQILAVSLPFSPLNEVQQRAVVKTVGERLLTPFGLRSLDRDDPDYKPRYEGSLFERDAAYHQGTVWPWLIGPYCEALLRVENFSDAAKQRVRAILHPLLNEMNNTQGGRCLGQIAEVYDAEPPHRPSGCPAQAWSVAEVLRGLTLAGCVRATID